MRRTGRLQVSRHVVAAKQVDSERRNAADVVEHSRCTADTFPRTCVRSKPDKPEIPSRCLAILLWYCFEIVLRMGRASGHEGRRPAGGHAPRHAVNRSYYRAMFDSGQKWRTLRTHFGRGNFEPLRGRPLS